jgi:hypothetical protein
MTDEITKEFKDNKSLLEVYGFAALSQLFMGAGAYMFFIGLEQKNYVGALCGALVSADCLILGQYTNKAVKQKLDL